MKQLDFKKTLTLLNKYGIKFVKSEIIKTKDDFKKTAYPVVLKIFSEKIVHKTEKRAVVLDIRNKKEALEAWGKLRKISPDILKQKMIRGQEVIIGMKKDAQFGPVIMFGLGGIFAEVVKDVSFRICPVDKKQAAEMIKEIKSAEVLGGWRGRKPAKIGDLADIIVRTSKLSLKENIKEIDLNPIMVNSQGAFVVDARIIV